MPSSPLRRPLLLLPLILTLSTLLLLLHISTTPFKDPNTGELRYTLPFQSPGVGKGFAPPAALLNIVNHNSAEDRAREAMRISRLSALLAERYEVDQWRAKRALNPVALDRLAECVLTDSCGPGEETVVILASIHFGGTGSSGEDIWALSTIEALQSLNHTLLYTYGHMDTLLIYQHLPDRVSTIIMDYEWAEHCFDRNATNHQALSDLETLTPGDWQGERKGCIRKEGFEEGIPIWKIFMFHFWSDPKGPLGERWTLSPVNYAAWGYGNNQHIGYSIESRCLQQPFHTKRHHRALALGKEYSYFSSSNPEYLFPHLLGPAAAAMPVGLNYTDSDDSPGKPVPFEIIATASPNEGMTEFPEVGVVNLGRQTREGFYGLVSTAKVMIGVGMPVISPSPYDSLCFGTPFINPIKSFDEADPENPLGWETQHNELRTLKPPYVYNVVHDDLAGLQDAIRSAIATPIDRFIPYNMTRVAVRDRHQALIETDWRAVAELTVKAEYTAIGEEFPYLL